MGGHRAPDVVAAVNLDTIRNEWASSTPCDQCNDKGYFDEDHGQGAVERLGCTACYGIAPAAAAIRFLLIEVDRLNDELMAANAAVCLEDDYDCGYWRARCVELDPDEK
jgi:hypothetical protein